MVTPKKITAFFGIVFFILFLISLAFPNGEINYAEGRSLLFPSLGELFSPEKVKYADISSLIEFADKLEDSVTISLPDTSPALIVTKPLQNQTKNVDTARADANKLLKFFRHIEFPDQDSTVLYPFFKELSRVQNNKKTVRIMHYGDSQIEGDRITSYIRDRMQRQFGGSGPGLLPVVQPYGQFSMKQDVSSNWNRYTVFGKKDSTLFHSKYGAMASFCRFSPHKAKKGSQTFDAWFKTSQSVMSYATAQKYEKFKIFYGYNKKPFLTQLFADEEMIYADFIPVTNDLKVLEWDFDKTPEEITVKMKGEDSPDFYAISLESKYGILVDNIPMRGSSGLIFTKIDKKLLKKMYEELDVKLLILQFGGNAVPYISNSYKKYGELFYNQLIRLKSILPDVPILVIGLADMSVKEKGSYVTYPFLPKVRDALKKASFEANCAYWDMYEAMGGKNSMPSWVNAKPSLASSDFIHFNHRGAHLIAEMFYTALMHEYNSYINSSGKGNLAHDK